MEAKELMIGNYVNLIADGHKHEPDTFKWSIDDYEYYETVMFNILPIPLTEWWLLKFGFEKDIDNDYCFKGFHLEDRNIDTFLPVEKILKLKDNFGCWYVGAYLRELKHVHQLQNLYFALTSKELTI